MAKPPPPDPFEFDPTSGAGSEVPTGRPGPSSERREEALHLDFSDVQGLEEQRRAPRRPGAARMDADSFLRRAEKEALQRAQSTPRASLPNLIERDERAVGVRVVHRTRRYGLLLALGVALSAAAVGAATWGLSRRRASATEREVEELRKSEALYRLRELNREKRIDR